MPNKTFVFYIHGEEVYDWDFTINAKNKKEAKKKIKEIINGDSADSEFLIERLTEKGSNGMDVTLTDVHTAASQTTTPDFNPDFDNN